MNKNTSQGQIVIPFAHDTVDRISVSSGERVRNQSTMILHAHVSHNGWTIGKLVAAQRFSLTPSTLSLS
jgi:hypothetical protein